MSFRLHYKEYLVGLINRQAIDPVEIMTVEQLKIQISKEKHEVPEQHAASDQDYKLLLIQVRSLI